MNSLRELSIVFVLAVLLTEMLFLNTVEAGITNPNLDLRISQSKHIILKNFSSDSDSPSINDTHLLYNQVESMGTVNKIRRIKRSPYPPGFVIWSAPSQVIPCHCRPGHLKCKCLTALQRQEVRSKKSVSIRRMSVRKSEIGKS